MTSSQGSNGSLLEGFDPAEPKEKKKISDGGGSRTVVVAVLLVVSVLVLVYVIWSTVSAFRNDPKRLARLNTLADSETREVFHDVPLEGSGFPQVNPKTGKRTLYPAETCYWTKDGKAKLEPTFVILGSWFGDTKPTRCPDCGRVVTKGNRMPPDALMQKAWDDAQRAK